MADFIQNNINFTISNNLQSGEKLHSIKGKLQSLPYPFVDYEGNDASKLINAVEIDWNKADLGNSYYINTTGELLSYISGLMQLVEYYEKPQKILVTYNTTNNYKAVFDVYKTVNINNTNIPLVQKVSLTGKKSYAILDARYVPTIHDSDITWKESTTTNSYIVLTATKDDNEGDPHAIVKSNICYIRPNDVINEITKKGDYVSQKIKAYTNIPIYNDASNPYPYKYIDVVISEGSISKISFPSNSASTINVEAAGKEITLQCELEHDKFNLTADDCNYTIKSGTTWITYKTKTLSNDKLYNFKFNVIANTEKSSRTTEITLNTIITDGTTKTIKYTINQEGRGEIITGVNSGVVNNEITIYTNGNINGKPTNYQLAPSLIKS